MRPKFKSIFIIVALLLMGSHLYGNLAKIKQLRAAQDKRMVKLVKLSKTLKTLSRPPKTIRRNSPSHQKSKKFSIWLMQTSIKVTEFTAAWKKKFAKFDKGFISLRSKKLSTCDKTGNIEEQAAEGSSTEQMMMATKEMQEMNQTFNLQLLTLQQKMQNDNRKFTALSNIMKTRHDTAKAAINNVR